MKIVPFQSILSNYKVVFLDSYGVVKNHQGLIPGVPEVISKIQSEGMELRLLTNDASRSQERQAKRFDRLGIHDLNPDHIITSGMMAKQFLENKFDGGKVAYLGTTQAAEYIIKANLEPIPVGRVDVDKADDIVAMVFWMMKVLIGIMISMRRSIFCASRTSQRSLPTPIKFIP